MSTVIHFAREKTHREIVENPDGTTTGLTYFEPTEEKMRALAEILFPV